MEEEKTMYTCEKALLTTPIVLFQMSGLSEHIPCPVCGKSFSHAGNMRAHVKQLHEKLKQFVCALCNKAFSQKVHLQRHVLSKHPGLMMG